MKRRILLISDLLYSGGVELVLQSLSEYACARGEEITIWAPGGSREILAEKYPAGVKWRPWPFWRKPVKRFSPAHLAQKLVKTLFEDFLLRLRKWDAVVAFKEGECMLLASKLRAKRKTAWLHADYSSFHWTEYCFADNEQERRCFESFDAVAAVSEAAKQGLIRTIGDPGNISVAYNPIDWMSIEKKAGLQQVRPPEGKTLLVSVGRLSAVKRYDMLIDICSELSKRFPFELWIVGGGELEDELRKKLKDEAVDCVRLLGQQPNPYPYIAAAHWLISSSESESYGIAVQEALVLGVPVIACRCPAIEESVKPGWGILAGMSREELKSAIEQALCRSELNSRMRADISAEYDKESLWQKRLDAMYRLIVGE